MMEAVIISETRASFYETTRHNIQEDSHVNIFITKSFFSNLITPERTPFHVITDVGYMFCVDYQ
jgi:hypothetical protein